MGISTTRSLRELACDVRGILVKELAFTSADRGSIPSAFISSSLNVPFTGHPKNINISYITNKLSAQRKSAQRKLDVASAFSLL